MYVHTHLLLSLYNQNICNTFDSSYLGEYAFPANFLPVFSQYQIPAATRRTLILLQNGLLCLPLCKLSIASIFLRVRRPYRAPKRFVDPAINILQRWGCPDLNRGLKVFFLEFLQEPKPSMLDCSHSSVVQATLQPLDFLYKAFAPK